MELINFTGIYQADGTFLNFTGYSEVTEMLMGLSVKSRKEGLLAIEDDLDGLENLMMKKQLQLVVDGTDPEIVRSIGMRRLENMLYTTGEILACVEFILTCNAGHEETGDFNLYAASRDISSSAGLVREIRSQIITAKNREDQKDSLPGRYRAMIDTANSGIERELKNGIIKNHIGSIININRIYNEIIITGSLGIQGGDNPGILRERLAAITG